MIRRLSSSDPKFKTLVFHRGMNVILADRSPGSSDRDTRNGAGKSSVVELIHFLLGADADKGTPLRDPDLEDDLFSLEIELAGKPVTVSRKSRVPGRVYFDRDTDASSWPIAPDSDLDGLSMRVDVWNALLGVLMFGLRLAPEEERIEKFGPSFRTLISYLVRRARGGGFDSPQATFRKQPLWQQQVSVAFLLGLDWTIPQAMERIRSKERMRRSLQKLLKEEGAEELRETFPSSSQLRTRLALAENRVFSLREALASFRVVAEYHALEEEVDGLTAQLAALADENVFDREVIADIEQAMAVEVAPDDQLLFRMYEEAGAALPERVRRRFDDVRAFHESVVRNRASYLEGELTGARARVTKRDSQQHSLDARRATILETLRTSGALESFTQLQAEFSRLQAIVEQLKIQHERASVFEDTGREIAIERSQLELRMAQNHREQAAQIERAVVLFADVSQRLYRQPGRLNVSNALSGPPISIEIPRKASEGVSTMQIFCFDLTLLQLCTERHREIDFLVHDSHLYDGVDDRQIRHALEVAAALATEKQLQYITTMNSDVASLIEAGGLDLSPFVVEPRLSDLEGEGLFGKRFGDTLRAD